MDKNVTEPICNLCLDLVSHLICESGDVHPNIKRLEWNYYMIEHKPVNYMYMTKRQWETWDEKNK